MGVYAEDVDADTDYNCLQEGYVCSFFNMLLVVDGSSSVINFLILLQITVTPLGALSPAESDSPVFFEKWLLRVAESLTSPTL